MDGWEIAVLVAAGYVAVTSLVRLMTRRRDALIEDLSQQAAAEAERRRVLERNKKRQGLRNKMNERKKDAA
jgi:hypothetical protein